MPRSEWLVSLGTTITVHVIEDPADPLYPRAFELLNKTNQFNTTGKRWSAWELTSNLGEGIKLFVGSVVDKYTNYGLTSVGVLDEATIRQFVMSCRIIGMDIEIAMIAVIVREAQARYGGGIRALAADTDLNLLSRDLFSRCGFSAEEDGWFLGAGQTVGIPRHMDIKMSKLAASA